MGYIKKLTLTILLAIFCSHPSAIAGWDATVNRMGYFGEVGAGGIYHWNEAHSAEFSIGIFDIESNRYAQVNAAYRYSLWAVEYESHNWVPLQLGVFAVRSLEGNHFFRTSPSKYPSSDYYDQTALRGGIEFGTMMVFSRTNLGFAYHVRVLDSGLMAVYNNAHRDLQYYLSSGLALRYRFP